MKIGAGPSNLQQSNSWRQQRVELTPQLRRWPKARQINMSHLASGVNALIGAPAAMNFYRAAGQDSAGLFQRALNGWPAGLDLPTGISRAIVGQGKFIALRNVWRRGQHNQVIGLG